jgi:rhodanese-related sulfurtransferase
VKSKYLIGVMAFLAILLAVILWGILDSVKTEKGNTAASSWDTLNQEQVIKELNNANVTVVDVRERELYEKAHIPGAINIPFNEFEERYTELNKTEKIIFVCHGGPMGEETSEFLIEKGYKNVANLKDGMASWSGPTE